MNDTRKLVLTARIEDKSLRHAVIGVFQNGGKAGILCVDVEFAEEIVYQIDTAPEKDTSCPGHLTETDADYLEGADDQVKQLQQLCFEAYHELRDMHAQHYWKTCEGGCPTAVLLDKLLAPLPRSSSGRIDRSVRAIGCKAQAVAKEGTTDAAP